MNQTEQLQSNIRKYIYSYLDNYNQKQYECRQAIEKLNESIGLNLNQAIHQIESDVEDLLQEYEDAKDYYNPKVETLEDIQFEIEYYNRMKEEHKTISNLFEEIKNEGLL